MIEIKFQGRGGQGIVMASEILAEACFEKDLFPQCYSIFGGERRGAPVAAFVRISNEKIYLKCDIEHPDHLILTDETLLSTEEIKALVPLGGTLLLNVDASFRFDSLKGYKIGRINALEVSKNCDLGSIVNTAILGAYIRLTKIVDLDTLLRIVKKTVPAKVKENLNAVEDAYGKLAIK